MKTKNKLIGAGAMLIAVGGVGSAAALAQTSAAATPPAVTAPALPKAAAAEPVSTADTDTLQVGDQATPDVPGAKDTPEPTDQKDSAKENTNETESSKNADGPGGHQDLPGQVDNQQDGQN